VAAVAGRAVAGRVGKSPAAFRTIGEVAEGLGVEQHVLRFWETKFPQVRPMKRGGGRRYYRPEDVRLLTGIRHLLYDQGYTIKGVQRILREQGAKAVANASQVPLAAPGAVAADAPPAVPGPRRAKKRLAEILAAVKAARSRLDDR